MTLAVYKAGSSGDQGRIASTRPENSTRRLENGSSAPPSSVKAAASPRPEISSAGSTTALAAVSLTSSSEPENSPDGAAVIQACSARTSPSETTRTSRRMPQQGFQPTVGPGTSSRWGAIVDLDGHDVGLAPARQLVDGKLETQKTVQMLPQQRAVAPDLAAVVDPLETEGNPPPLPMAREDELPPVPVGPEVVHHLRQSLGDHPRNAGLGPMRDVVVQGGEALPDTLVELVGLEAPQAV